MNINSQPFSSNLQNFSELPFLELEPEKIQITIEHFFLTVGQNNY